MQSLVFYTNKKLTQRSDHPNSVQRTGEYPCFVLVFNYDWDDSGYKTWFCLYYMPSSTEKIRLGEMKLMKAGEQNTFDTLPRRFEGRLDETYCSLGISTNYYKNIRTCIKDLELRNSLLEALCDCVHDSRIREKFQYDDVFHTSLIADQASEEALRIGEFILTDTDYRSAFKFTYKYFPKYDETDEQFACFDANFDLDSPEYMRTIALVGENGVGKTQMLCGLVEELLKKTKAENLSAVPKFHSCLTICSSPYDGFMEIPDTETRIDYYKCCLGFDKEKTKESLKDALEEIIKRPLLFNRPMADVYNDYVEKFLVGQLNGKLIENTGNYVYSVNEGLLYEAIPKLSSGHLHILELITYLCAYTHISSLVVIDELEVHLHPHLIMRYMSLLNRILSQFQGYAILSTHSPLVVREVVNSNVYRFTEGENRQPLIATVSYRTFGEDVTTLFRNIFGYDESESYFTEIVLRLLEHDCYVWSDENELYENVVEELEKHMQLGLSSKMCIQNIVKRFIEGKNNYSC